MDEQLETVIGDGDLLGLKDKHVMCLDGLLYTPRIICVEVILKTRGVLWKGKGCQVRVLGDNKFLFIFNEIKDKQQILNIKSWSFDNYVP